jgi:hypothetical protein
MLEKETRKALFSSLARGRHHLDVGAIWYNVNAGKLSIRRTAFRGIMVVNWYSLGPWKYSHL